MVNNKSRIVSKEYIIGNFLYYKKKNIIIINDNYGI